MKKQILISLLTFLSVAGFAEAVNLYTSEFSGLLQNGPAAYKKGELVVRFAEVDAGTQLPDGPVVV